MRPNRLELSGTWFQRAEDLSSLWPNRPSAWPLDTPGAWGISGLRLFNLVWTEPGGSVQPGPGDGLEASSLLSFFKVLPMPRNLGEGSRGWWPWNVHSEPPPP